MSNEDAKRDAAELYKRLREKWTANYIGMIADRLKRLVSRDTKPKENPEKGARNERQGDRGANLEPTKSSGP